MTSTTITSTEIIAAEVRTSLASIGVDPAEVTGPHEARTPLSEA